MKDYIKVKFNFTKFYRDNDIIFFYPSIVILRYNITKIVGSYNYKKKKITISHTWHILYVGIQGRFSIALAKTLLSAETTKQDRLVVAGWNRINRTISMGISSWTESPLHE